MSSSDVDNDGWEPSRPPAMAMQDQDQSDGVARSGADPIEVAAIAEQPSMLEVVSRTPAVVDDRRPPLLFVHGTCHGAWCWEEHFLDYFAGLGWSTYALSLRGHGSSCCPTDVRVCRIADYVADVQAVAASLPQPPVLIGHSMGGFVVQKYLENNRVPAAVLLASMPPRGGLATPFLRRHLALMLYYLARRSVLGVFGHPRRCREAFFSADTPSAAVERYRQMLSEDSPRMVVDMFIADRPVRRNYCPTPILVMGAANDGVFSTAQIQATAAYYRTSATIIDHTGHDMMLESTWPTTADHINNWLLQQLEDHRPSLSRQPELHPSATEFLPGDTAEGRTTA